MTRAEFIAATEADRSRFMRVFSSEDGQDVLAWLLNECGHFATDPEAVDPRLHALGNRLLLMCGVVHPANLQTMTAALLSASNNEDLRQMRMQGNLEEEIEG